MDELSCGHIYLNLLGLITNIAGYQRNGALFGQIFQHKRTVQACGGGMMFLTFHLNYGTNERLTCRLIFHYTLQRISKTDRNDA